MNLNPNFIICLPLSLLWFIIGSWLKIKIKNKKILVLIVCISAISTFPGLSMLLYYFHFFEPESWYIEFRSFSGIEILVSLFGLFLGIISGEKIPKLISIIILFLLVSVPFIKPVIRPIYMKESTEWKDGVCIQSTGASCGPSCLASIFKYYGIVSTEKEIAKESFTCGTGTEIWYLLRYAKRKGLNYSIKKIKSDSIDFPVMIGTHLLNIGHFITILGKSEDTLIIGDPFLEFRPV